MIVVQRLRTQWTKASRGAPGASARNATPEALALPRDLVSAREACLHHVVDFVEREDFVARARVAIDSHVSPMAPFLGRVCSVTLARVDDALAVGFRRDADLGSGSGRAPDGPCFVLRPGQWGRVLYNGRFSDMDSGDWYYEKKVFNIGNVASVTDDLFLCATPTFVCAHLARLR